MKFSWIYLNEKTALHLAIEKENLDIVKIILSSDFIDADIKTI